MPRSAASTEAASRPSTALIEPWPAGAASAIALPRSVTAVITRAGSTAPAAASAPYSPTEWPAAPSGWWPARASSSVRPMPMKVSAGWAFWVRRSSSSVAVVSRWRRSTPVSEEQRSQRSATSGSVSRSAPMPACWDPWPGKRKASFTISPYPLSRFDYFLALVLAAVGADRVWALHVLAVRAGLDLHERQRQVRAATPLLRLGQLDLR